MQTAQNRLYRACSAVGYLTLLAVVSSGCGRIGGSSSRDRYAPSSSYSATSVLGASGGLAGGTAPGAIGYTCASHANVRPDYDYNRDGTGHYTVCPKTGAVAEVLVYGEIHHGSKLCLFPAQVVDDSHIYLKPDAQSGLPWVQCVAPSEAGAALSFADISWNAAFIVPNTEVAAMQACLGAGNYYGCPAYSFGQFR